MINLRRICCVCLVKRNKLEKITAIQDGISYHEKLSTLFPQMKIDEIREIVYICEECKISIDNMYTFREMCLRNNDTLWTYIKKLHLNENGEFNETNDVNKSEITEENDNETECEPIVFHQIHLDEFNDEGYVVKNEPNVIIKDEIEIIDDYRFENNTFLRNSEDSSSRNDNEISTNELNKLNTKKTNKTTKSSNKKTYKCEICDKSFGKTSHLNQHIRIHTGEKPFKCEICGKSYTDKSSLRSHNRVHTKEKPFKCKVCNKSFTESSNLTVHSRIHTGERPYKCEMCDKSFNRSSRLKQHIKIHMDDNAQLFIGHDMN